MNWFCCCIHLGILLMVKGRLPTIVEDRTDSSKDVFRVTPEPPVTLDDILVYNGFPLDNLQYIFDYKQAKWVERFRRKIEIPERTFANAQRHSNCKALFSPGKVSFHQYTANYDSNTAKWYYSRERFIERDVGPYMKYLQDEEDQKPLKLLRDNCDLGSYSGCWEITEIKQARFYIVNAKNLLTLMTGRCDLCIISECATSCPQGTFATKAASYDLESGLQKTPFECRSCPSGTWNTCLRSNECFWKVPESGGYPANGSETPYLRPAPVGTCFACEQARQWPQHYLNTRRAYTLPPNLKAWKCPGGDAAPVACPSNQFTHSDDWSECICDGANYPDPSNSSVCIPCPTGHYCVKGKKYQCSTHYYQPETGQSACMQCASRPDKSGEYSLCEGNKQLQICDRDKPSTQNQPLANNCVECSKCKRLYSTIESGQLECYRSYKAGTG